MQIEVTGTGSEIDEVREELRICRLELAQVRAAQEEAAEAAVVEKRRLKRAQKQLQKLAEAAHQHLEQDGHGLAPGLARRVGRRLPGRGADAESEEQQVALLGSSELFAGPWYLIQHPEVVASGESAALHYLRHGAAAGFNPSPRFNTQDYLRTHPEVEASGANPLVHRLTDGRPDARSSQE